MSAGDRESEWVRQARSGDLAALKLLLADARQPLLASIQRQIPARARCLIDAEDVLQDALVIVTQKLSEFEDRGPGSFQRWMATISLRRLRNWLRDLRALRRGGILPPPQQAGDSFVELLTFMAD